ncbi:unnamed protein product [Auanema sp. JU1783]|nr:unnamed protein product [Auanema sp. JU1783]
MTTVAADQENSLGISNTTIHNFQAMFPTKTIAQIESVLQKHHGDLANTIDELLADQSNSFHTNPNPMFFNPNFSSFAHASSSATYPIQMTSPVPPPPPYSEAIRSSAHPHSARNTVDSSPFHTNYSAAPANISLTRRHHSADNANHLSSIANARNARSRAPRISLNEFKQEKRRLDHLKKENERRLENVTDEMQARILEDEQLALLMQDRELNRCMGIAPVNQRRSSSTYHSEAKPQPKPRRRATSPGPLLPEGPLVEEMVMRSTERDFREKLKIISKASKARLSQITSRFRKDDN